ncbi:MAG: heavy metal-binding domain-containing protein [Coriobacteriia bacterium]|nr:heavy metal-binding domain-containing protein [Coriobacteriia bacterium]
MIITTTSGIEGHKIVEYKGIVSSTSIHGIAVGKDLRAAGRNLVGGRSSTYEDEIGGAQGEALEELQAAAEAVGANAIVGVTIDLEALGNGNMLMVSMAGTAVVLD